MDYKVLILLLALLLLVILLYKEMSDLKQNLSGNMNKFLNVMRADNTKNLENIMSDVNNCVSQIKNIGTDNLQQLKRLLF